MTEDRRGYAHFGEDLIVHFLFGDEYPAGLYVDVGCYHPSLFSNTCAFYERGWRGILVDANPFMINLCREARPEDLALNLAIGDKDGETTLFKFGDWGSSNTIDPDFRDYIARTQQVDVTENVLIEMRTLANVFDEHLDGRVIDFLNVDVENVDLNVLQGNDWERFRPKVIAIEDLSFKADHPEASAIHVFLASRAYSMESRAVFTSIYVDDKARHLLSSSWRDAALVRTGDVSEERNPA